MLPACGATAAASVEEYEAEGKVVGAGEDVEVEEVRLFIPDKSIHTENIRQKC